jgi:hypothetical protein
MTEFAIFHFIFLHNFYRFPDTKGYNTDPEQDGFFKHEIHSDYGKAFMTW